jgi:hypothetical protein
MCSYNRINNSYGSQNSYTLNYLLKNELDFQGFGKAIPSKFVQHLANFIQLSVIGGLSTPGLLLHLLVSI